jgi:opacity protein-like surface antigen
MKKLIFALFAAALIAPSVSAQVRVKGYTRSDGTYVAPHYRSSPNSTTLDNYSTKGNVNPYTGEVGTRNPYSSPTPSTSSTYRSPYAPATKTPCYFNCPD